MREDRVPTLSWVSRDFKKRQNRNSVFPYIGRIFFYYKRIYMSKKTSLFISTMSVDKILKITNKGGVEGSMIFYEG